MKNALTSFYDNRTGLALTLVLLAGLLAGGLLAYEPDAGAEQGEAVSGEPTSTVAPQATAESIRIPTPEPSASLETDGDTPGEAPPQAVALDNGWLWHAPDTILNAPIPLADGLLPILLANGTVYFLAPDGSLAGSVGLPEFEKEDRSEGLPVDFFPDRTVVAILPDRVYAMQAGAGQVWEFPVNLQPQASILGHYISGDVHYLLDMNLVLYAYTGADGLLWQVPLESPLRDDFFPVVGEEGRIYLADSGGTVYAFDAAGLAWTYTAQEDRRSATNISLGPDGNLYYVTASFSYGYLVSLTQTGEERWVSELDTFRFTVQQEFSAAGKFILVGDDFVESETGAIRQVEFPFDVTDFIAGEDEKDYLLTGSHLIQWELGPDGYRELRDTTVNLGDTSRFFRPFARVYPSGLIEFLVYRQQSIQVIWVNPDTGENITFDRPWSQLHIGTNSTDLEHAFCSQNPDSMLLTCEKHVPGITKPVWKLDIDGINGSITGFPPSIHYVSGRLYLVAGEQTIYAFNVEIP